MPYFNILNYETCPGVWINFITNSNKLIRADLTYILVKGE